MPCMHIDGLGADESIPYQMAAVLWTSVLLSLMLIRLLVARWETVD